MSEIPMNAQENKTSVETQEPKLCWYVVHTYAGYENKVMDTLKKSVENSERMKKLIFEIVIPTEEVVEIKTDKNGKKQRKSYQRKVFPGYVMIHMIWTTESWYLVRNTRGVTGFVGPESKPVPLSDAEVEQMLNPRPTQTKIDVAIGQEVHVLSGNLEGWDVIVKDIDPVLGKVTVRFQIPGGEGTSELDLDQVEPKEE